MVGRERRGGRQRRAGRAGTDTPVYPATSLGDPASSLAESERARPPRPPGDCVSRAHGALRRERPPTPQAPQGRGAQSRSRERSSRECNEWEHGRRAKRVFRSERWPARRSLVRSRDVERPRAFESNRSRHCSSRYSVAESDSSSMMTFTPSGETSSGIPSTVN